ncbi:hypothetical protein BS50DRAFT_574028 [Corynespora cassiicola Philippines]|uniref:FAD-binding FR-type domain-containing protein n=1 Tax=Corynespora cassiicola Philippines TaxID=1448308 RepID=A0A2T2NPE7_CORCC|nr:hypothetical protein BS50DRAFT_574028 [Corynespora cassiicola Philippines]
MDSLPLSWTRDILRFSLKATADTPEPWVSASGTVSTSDKGDLVDPNDPGKDPRFRKLVEAILFSRRWMNTYNLVLVGILVLFAAWHWGEKFVLRRRRLQSEAASADPGEDEAWSSSSSTIEGTATPPDPAQGKSAVAVETTPLLSSPGQKKPGIWKPYYLLKAWLQYQPSPLPIFNKTLPTNAVSLLVIAYIALNIFYSLYGIPWELQYVFVFADRCGIVFTANLPLLYLLAAKNQPIKLLTGYSYESLNIFHRRVGELVCFAALLHLLGMFFVWYGLLRRLGFTLARFILNRVVLLGLGAFFSYESLYLTSLGSFRQRWYEVFLALHIFLQLAALAFVWFHHSGSRPYVAISAAIFLIDRLVFRLWLKSSSHPATLTVLEDEDTILLSSDWDVLDRKSALITQNMKDGWKPNDHVFITIPTLSKKHSLQSHPFTIFSAAPTTHTESSNGRPHAWFTLLIRAQKESGFTRQLLEYARSHTATRIRLDGPYGSSHALDLLSSSDNAIVVAGGSGIAVAYPLLWALLHPRDPESGAPPKRKVKLLWITHAPTHRLWLPSDKLQELQDWGLDMLTPPPTALAGRPDIRMHVANWIEGARTSIVVSGPDGLVRAVRNTSASLIAAGADVNVQVEKFGW